METYKRHVKKEKFTLNIFRQPILKRDDKLFGNEVHAETADQDYFFSQTHSTPQPNSPLFVYSKILSQSQLLAVSLREIKDSPSTDVLNRKFININLPHLLNSALINEINITSSILVKNNHQLVITINTPSLKNIDPREKIAIINQIYLLKDSGIEMAFDGYDLSEKSAQTLIHLNLLDYIKVNFKRSNFCPNNNSDYLNRYFDRMTAMIYDHKVRFLADQVEHRTHHLLARSMPFELFQGDYYSPAEGV